MTEIKLDPARCKQTKRVGRWMDRGEVQCTRKPKDGCDGYCGVCDPRRAAARDEARKLRYARAERVEKAKGICRSTMEALLVLSESEDIVAVVRKAQKKIGALGVSVKDLLGQW